MSDPTFYVKDVNGNLVPAKFMASPDGSSFIQDPNNINVNQAASNINGHYYDATGKDLGNFNPNNYLVVPTDFNINSVISFGKYVATLDSSQQLVVMYNSFHRGGQWDLQRSYVDRNGNYVQGLSPVPMFQDAASYTLGLASAPGGLVNLAITAGGFHNYFGGGDDTSGAWWNNPRNVNSIYAGANLAGITPSESPRVLRRLQVLREWSHEEIKQVFPRGSGTCGADGAGASERLSITMGRHRIDRAQDWLRVADAA